MFDWLIHNWLTIVVLAIVVLILVAVILRMIRNKRRGISSCSCGGCSGCAMKGTCHPEQNA